MELLESRTFFDEHGLSKFMFIYHLNHTITLYVNLDGSVVIENYRNAYSEKDQFYYLESRICLENGFRILI